MSDSYREDSNMNSCVLNILETLMKYESIVVFSLFTLMAFRTLSISLFLTILIVNLKSCECLFEQELLDARHPSYHLNRDDAQHRFRPPHL